MIEIIEIDTGGRVITTPSTSVIGIVGVAPSANETNFPLNKPVLLTSVQQIESLELGEEGTIASSLRSIYNQVNAVCVVVRVEEGADVETTISNIAGDFVSFTGVYALLQAQELLKVKPKLLLAPYYSSIATVETKPNAIVNNLIDLADKLRAVAIVDGLNTTSQEAVSYVSNISSARVFVSEPSYSPYFALPIGIESISTSPLVAGVFAKNDAKAGFWVSPSNTEVKGVQSLSRPISFSLSDKTAESYLLNQAGVNLIAFVENSYKVWGTRSPSVDSKWRQINVRRTVDTIYDAIDKNMIWALAKPYSKQLFSDIQNNLQNYLNTLISQGALLGGQVWVDGDANTLETYNNKELIVDFDLEPSGAVEALKFRSYRNETYIEELFNQTT